MGYKRLTYLSQWVLALDPVSLSNLARSLGMRFALVRRENRFPLFRIML
jgi:hypothetical protein